MSKDVQSTRQPSSTGKRETLAMFTAARQWELPKPPEAAHLNLRWPVDPHQHAYSPNETAPISANGSGLLRLIFPAGGTANTVAIIIFAALSAFLVFFAMQGPEEQIIRVSLWLALLVSVTLAFRSLVAALKAYRIRFFHLPSSWLMIPLSFLTMLSTHMIGQHPNYITDGEALMLVATALFFVISLVSNMTKTGFLFGVVLTFIQVMLSPIIVIGLLAVLADIGKKDESY